MLYEDCKVLSREPGTQKTKKPTCFEPFTCTQLSPETSRPSTLAVCRLLNTPGQLFSGEAPSAGSLGRELGLLCMCAQSCPTPCNPMDCSPPGSSVQGIFQARILQWVAISFSRRSSQPRDQTHISCISCIGRWILYHLRQWL